MLRSCLESGRKSGVSLLTNLITNGAGTSLAGWSICTGGNPTSYQSTCTNGNSACGSGFGWLVTAGNCPINGIDAFFNACTGTNFGFMQQTLTLNIGGRYLFSVDVKAHASGQTTRKTYIGIDAVAYATIPNTAFGTTVGTQTFAFTATATSQVLFLSANGDTGGNGNCKYF